MYVPCTVPVPRFALPCPRTLVLFTGLTCRDRRAALYRYFARYPGRFGSEKGAISTLRRSGCDGQAGWAVGSERQI